MKKFVLPLLMAAVIASPAFAAKEVKKEEAKKETTATEAAEAAPAAGEATYNELKDGTKVKIMGDEVFVLKAAPDGTHELKDGSKVETKDGKIVKK